MKVLLKFIHVIILLIHGFFSVAQKNNIRDSSLTRSVPEGTYIQFDDTRNIGWSKDFSLVEFESSLDTAIQKAYFYKTKGAMAKPLIVSLHTWSGSYSQTDELAELCKEKDLNYIHPDFRGPNKTISACCSELALADIDDAITYALENAKVDTTKIYVMGVSGGGYATLSTFMKSKHPIKKFSAWASITNLEAWYHESSILKNKYAENILQCTGSKTSLDSNNARKRSPFFMKTPTAKLTVSKLFIFAGVYDGMRGSVPITHSINIYNKLLEDLGVKEKTKFVSDLEKLQLLEYRKPLGKIGSIAGRKICLQKQYGNLQLTIFEGEHEMLTEYALNQILKD